MLVLSRKHCMAAREPCWSSRLDVKGEEKLATEDGPWDRRAAGDRLQSSSPSRACRESVADRVQLQKQTATDPNVNIITRDSVLVAAELEEEAILLRNQLVSQLFTLKCVRPPVLSGFAAEVPVTRPFSTLSSRSYLPYASPAQTSLRRSSPP